MKINFRHWWTGMKLITTCSLPFLGVFAALRWLEPALVDGLRPLWWRFVSTALSFAALVVIPLFVCWGARQVVRADDWLSSPADDDATPAA